MGQLVSINATPKTLEDRLECARGLRRLGLELPLVVDGMSDTFAEVYAAWPERFYIFSAGLIAYVAQPRRAAYCPAELRVWLSIFLRQEQEEQKKAKGRGGRGGKQRASAKASTTRGKMLDLEDFGEAEAALHDLVSEYQQYNDATTMLSEFDESGEEEDAEEDEEED
eukprot:TRINITY_DN48653_c0_g1_i1.p2 TRINITY_DN48653_c0_g1~~TRINITY_DN48653_c0_g1_i1.p2  ORF type:complete len:168 (-),score=35.64 TRINITY_DN48653_c0_g1_i1:361-864(-)